MSARGILTAVAVTLAAGSALAQGFAGLGNSAEGFAVPRAGTPLAFPADHGAHCDFRIEWWYLTANLKGADGRDYGVQWTLFRSAREPVEQSGWSSPQTWLGHAAVTTATQHLVSERLARGGIGQAGVVDSPFSASIDDWSMASRAEAGADPLSRLELDASGTDFTYALSLTAAGPLVLHGEGGYSVKSNKGQASYYYSQPFYRVIGTVTLATGPIEVSGEAWLDHEWSSQPLAADQTGWDWLSLHINTGEKLMGFRLRDGGQGFTSATWIGRDGNAAALPPGALTLTPLASTEIAGRSLPTRWRVELPSKGLVIETRPLNPQAWMTTQIPYWEGPVLFSGTASGQGYLEMTGYE